MMRGGRWAALLLVGLSGMFAADRTPPHWEKPLRAGLYLYRENCSVCHEINRPRQGKKFGPSLFRLFQNEKLPVTRGKPTDEYVADKIRKGGPVMPAFGDYLNDRQIEDVIEYIRTKH